MARGKRKKHREQRARAAQQKNTAPKPPEPTLVATPQIISAMEANSTKASDDKSTSQNKGEGPSRAEFSNWQARSYRLEKWQGFFSACLVGLAAVGAIVGYGQWDATRKQYDAMERQLDLMELDQRPWVTFSSPEMKAPAEGEAFNGIVEIKNIGKTPATIRNEGFAIVPRPKITMEHLNKNGRDLRLELNIDIKKLIDDFRGEPYLLDDVVIPPGASVKFALSGLKQYTKEDLDGLKSGSWVVAVLVYTRYRDTVGRDHETWTCFAYDPISDKTYLHSQYGHMD